MINTSDEYKRIIGQGSRSIYADVKVRLTSGELLEIPQNKIRGLAIEDDVSGRSSFDIGAAIINQIALKVDNTDSAYSDKEFDQAEITVKIGLQLSETVEWIGKGIFTADPGDVSGDVITIKAYDNMRKFDHAYADSNLIYPATLGQIVRDACDMCGVSFVTPASPAFDYVVESKPFDETLTFREILHLVGQIACCWFRCDKNGAMEAGFFDLDGYEAETESAFHKIDNLMSFSRSTDDVVITGVRIIQNEESGDKAYQSGADGYVLSVEHNPLIQGDSAQTVADMLGEKLIGLRFRKLSVSHQSDPSIEAGDLAVVTDRKGAKYKTLLTSTMFQLGGIQKSACNAETPTRKSVQRFSESTKAYVEMRKLLREEKTAREIAIESLATTLANSGGLYMTTEEMGDGSFIYYAHNKPTMEESDIVWLFTAEAIGISTDGGKTYPYGFTVTGEMVMRILQAEGINADWINAGAFTIKDDKGNVIFSADKDTKQIRFAIPSEKGTLGGLIDNHDFSFTFTDLNGNEISGLKFDFETGQFIFDGSGHFTGSIDIASKFIVDIFGNAHIYGGKYYAMDEDGNISGFTSMDKDGFTVYSKDTIPVIKIGFPEGNLSYPYVRLNSGENANEQAGIIKKFANGLWIGNDAPADAFGTFYPQKGYNGMFVSFEDGKTYVVAGTDMQNVYTGESIARFG